MQPQFAIRSADDGLTWTGPGRVRIRDVEYTVVFSRNGCCGPCLRLDSVSEAGGSLFAIRDSCGCGWATFRVFGEVPCDGQWSQRGPCRNGVSIRVEWTCCPIPGWAGDGWYCARDAGTDGPCVPVELNGEAGRCDESIEICSGPYRSLTDADVFCNGAPGPGNSCADATPVPVGYWITGELAGPIGTGGFAAWCVAVRPNTRYRMRFYGYSERPGLFPEPPIVRQSGGSTWTATGYGAECGAGSFSEPYVYAPAGSGSRYEDVPGCGSILTGPEVNRICFWFVTGSGVDSKYGFVLEEGGPC